jgi:hypothetical protein
MRTKHSSSQNRKKEKHLTERKRNETGKKIERKKNRYKDRKKLWRVRKRN